MLSTLDRAYVDGFVAKCAEAGVDAEELLKASQQTNKYPKQQLSGGLIYNLIGNRTMEALPDPAVVAGKKMPDTIAKPTSVPKAVNTRKRQLETIAGR